MIAYTYFGYVLYLLIRSRFWSKPVATGAFEPTVSVLLPVHNEEGLIQQKLTNLLSLDYPRSKLEILVVSDASTDRTEEITADAQQKELTKIELIRCPIRCGKAGALTRAIAAARGEILFFTDVRQMIEPGALRALVANFADLSIGCVSGELMLGPANGRPSSGISLYWRFEKAIRKLEASFGSTIGATGAIYATRRSCTVQPPVGTLLDDLYIPAHVARRGLRIVFEQGARAWDHEMAEMQELRRRVRTLAGNYQLLELAPWLLTEANPIRFGFISHKLCRLLVPFLLLVALTANVALIGDSFYRALLAAQILFYLAALTGFLLPRRIVPRLCGVALSFLLLNTAALLAPFEYLSSRNAPIRLWPSRSTAP